MNDSPTYFSESDQKPIPIRDRVAMPDRRLEHTINKVARGDDTQVLVLLRAERDRRIGLGDWEPDTRSSQQPLPRDAVMGDNAPPTDEEAMRLRLEDNHAKLLAEASELELKASKLPKVVESDEDVAAISSWIVQAQGVTRWAENERKDAKDPYLRAGQAVDAFFGGLKTNIASRITGLESRNAPYLKAKRDAAEAARQLELADERRRQQEADALAASQREERDRLQREADDTAARLRAATTAEEADRLQQEARAANERAAAAGGAVQEADAAAQQAQRDLQRAEHIAETGGASVLSKVHAGGATSTLETVWAPDVHNRARLIAGLGPLGPFFTDKEIEAALNRAAKAVTRPAVAGVDWIPEDTVKTRRAGA